MAPVSKVKKHMKRMRCKRKENVESQAHVNARSASSGDGRSADVMISPPDTSVPSTSSYQPATSTPFKRTGKAQLRKETLVKKSDEKEEEEE